MTQSPGKFFKKLTFDWERFPALYIFASLLSGAFLFYGIIFPLFFALTHKNHIFKIGYIFLASFSTLLYQIGFQEPPSKRVLNIKGYLKPLAIKNTENRHYLKAKLVYALDENKKEYKNLNCMISISEKMNYKMNSDFLVTGILKSSPYGYSFIPKKMKKAPYSFSFTDFRFQIKKKARKILESAHLDKDIENYFSALVTAHTSSRFLKGRFLQAGMLHTLAISGFHFSWIIFLLSIPLTLFLPKKNAIFILLLLAWLYFFFLGSSSSISRSWIAISVYLVSLLTSKIPLPLNSLGIAGVVSIVIDPTCVFELGFILSFLATFTILTLYSFINELSELICEKRTSEGLLLMPVFEKAAYRILRFLSVSFFLSLVINIFMLPIFLSKFKFFTLLGVFYNLFFPISMIPTLILLLLTFCLYPFTKSLFLLKIAEFLSQPFLESILYGTGFFNLLIKLPRLNSHVISFFSCALILYCFMKEKEAFEEKLILQDGFSLT